MRAVQYHKYGGPDVTTVAEIPRPEPGAGEVLVDVRAASVNPIDTYVREGSLEPPDGLPHVGGSDFAGVVESVGQSVTAFEEGDRVFGTGLGIFSPGTFAEYTVASADGVAPLPEAVSYQDGAAAAMAYATAWRALLWRGDLAFDDVCLVHGASGGVGHAAVQLAASAGAHVIGTAREGEPAAFVESLGADAVVDYRSDNLADAVRAGANDRPVDVALETHADASIDADLEVLSRGGRIVVIGEGGPIEITPEASMTAKKADADVRFMSLAASREDQAPILRRVGPRLADGTFTVHVDETYGLAEVSEAHERLAESGIHGKIVVDVGE
ncbi:NADPH:quinone reductase [Natrialbaceae archaeon A-gly3]